MPDARRPTTAHARRAPIMLEKVKLRLLRLGLGATLLAGLVPAVAAAGTVVFTNSAGLGAMRSNTAAPASLITAWGASIGATASVRIDGLPASIPISFAGNGQVNFYLPSEVPGSGAAVVRFFDGGGRELDSGTLNLAPTFPGVFTADSSGQGPVAGYLYAGPGGGPPTFLRLGGTTYPREIRSSDPKYLVYYGTGRGNCAGPTITASWTHQGQAQTRSLVPSYYGMNGSGWAGVDQVNLDLASIYDAMAVGKDVALRASCGGETSNPVSVRACGAPPALNPPVCATVGGQGLKCWLGAAQPAAVQGSPKYRIPVQANGFDGDSIDCNYRMRLEAVDQGFDAALAKFAEYGVGLDAAAVQSALATLTPVTVIQTLGFNAGAYYAGNTNWNGSQNRIEVVGWYRNSQNAIARACNVLQHEFHHAIGNARRISCAGVIGHPVPNRPGFVYAPNCSEVQSALDTALPNCHMEYP